jgi:hypothetical protein
VSFPSVEGIVAPAASRVRQRLSRRRLQALAPYDRAIVLALVVASLIAMTWIALSTLDAGPIRPDASDGSRAASAVALFAGFALAMAVAAGSVEVVEGLPGFRGWFLRLGIWFLPTTGLVLLAICVVLVDDGLRTAQDSNWPYTRLVMWVSLAVACLYVARPRRPRSEGLVDADRALRVVVPAMLVVVIVATPVTTGSSFWDITLLLLGVLSTISNLGISALIGILVTLTVKGLETTQARGKLISAYFGQRQRTLVAIVGAKLLGIFAIWFAYRTLSPGDAVLELSLASWIMAFIAAAVAVALFAVDGHVQLSTSDHDVISRYSGIVLGAALTLGFSAALVIGVMGSAVPTRPWGLIGASLLMGSAVVLARFRSWPAAAVAYVVAISLGAASAILLSGRRVFALPIFDGSDDSMSVLTGIGAGVAMLATAIAVIWIIVACIVSRRFGWLVYLATVLVWATIQTVWSVVAPFDLMTFDLALTLLLGVAVVLLIVGAQRAVDAFEIVVVAVTTFLLIEVPLISDLLPPAVQSVLLLAAVLTPGVAVIWNELATLSDPPPHRGALVRITLTTAVYCQLSVGVWLGSVDIARAVALVTDFAQQTLMVPLLLLLVAAHHSVRAHGEPSTSTRTGTVTNPSAATQTHS